MRARRRTLSVADAAPNCAMGTSRTPVSRSPESCGSRLRLFDYVLSAHVRWPVGRGVHRQGAGPGRLGERDRSASRFIPVATSRAARLESDRAGPGQKETMTHGRLDVDSSSHERRQKESNLMIKLEYAISGASVAVHARDRPYFRLQVWLRPSPAPYSRQDCPAGGLYRRRDDQKVPSCQRDCVWYVLVGRSRVALLAC